MAMARDGRHRDGRDGLWEGAGLASAWAQLVRFARSGMKAYLVLDLSVNDFGGFRKYIAEIPAFIAKHSGKYLVRGVQPTTIEGDWKPERMVIIEFPEREKAEAFLGDPEIQDLFKVRHDTTTSKLVLADGCT
jgi:uncharacterized protein (DUF1330 family)